MPAPSFRSSWTSPTGSTNPGGIGHHGSHSSTVVTEVTGRAGGCRRAEPGNGPVRVVAFTFGPVRDPSAYAFRFVASDGTQDANVATVTGDVRPRPHEPGSVAVDGGRVLVPLAAGPDGGGQAWSAARVLAAGSPTGPRLVH